MKQTKKINWGWMFLSVLPVASLLAAGLGFAEPAIAGPDLQVRVWVDARSVHKNSNNTYNFTIRGYVKNIGNVNYVSRQNQQVLFLHKVGSSQHITDWHFTRLNRGQAMNVHVPVINQPGGEFVPSYELALSFDPDIYMDRNSANDDRNSRNNQATISSRTISGAFARASGGVQVRPVGVRTGGLDNPIILPKPRGKLTDLIPVVVNANQGAIQVKNIGGGSAGSSKLFVICSVVLSDGRNTVPCAAGLHLPNYDAANNTLMYRIPALRPGASHALRLFGPRALPRRPGIYGMKLFADGERRIAESNERNNAIRLDTVINSGALPDLKIVRVTTRINSRVMGICRTGRKARPQSSIEVLNFDLEVKNVGRGTAYMNRDGVIVSAQTMDFHERVFDTSKYYLGGRGGPGYFMGPHGRQNWILKKMAQVNPGKTFKATSHLGIGYNNKTFTINRLRELAGQTHRFRIKLTSYGKPGLKESNTRNNEYIVSYTFPRNFCMSQVVGEINTLIGNNQTVKPNISGFQFAGGKRCIAPGGIFTIKGSAFGNSADSRTIELGGNGLGVNLTIKSWNSRIIRVQLPRATRLQYRKNYWVRIQAPAVAGSVRTLSNLKRGVVLCPPTVHAGGSGSSGNQSAGQQNGGRGINVQTGLPDLVISRLVMGNPSPGCFAYSDGAGNKKFYKLAPIPTTITLKNIGSVSYSTRDRSRNKPLAIGIIGDRFVGRPDRHGYSLCAVPLANIRLSNLNIPAGGSKTIRTNLKMEVCKVPKKGAVKKRTTRLPQSLVNSLLGRSRSIKIGIGKAVFIKNKIPQEGNYNNNFQRSMFRFPDRICRGR